MAGVTEATFGSLTKRQINFAKTTGISLLNQLGPMTFKSVPVVQEAPKEEALKNLAGEGHVEVVS